MISKTTTTNKSKAEESFGNFMLIDYFLYFLLTLVVLVSRVVNKKLDISRFHLFHFDTQRRTIFRGCVSGTQIVAREIEMWDFYLIMNSYLEWF
jgi:hypothetical protein